MKFPITEQQFRDWLAAKPRERCNKPLNGCECPLVNAVFDLTGKKLDSFDFVKRPRLFPRWVHDLTEVIDAGAFGWSDTRGRVLRLLEAEGSDESTRTLTCPEATISVFGGKDQRDIHIVVARGFVVKRILPEWDEGEIRITLEPVPAEKGVQ